MLHGSLALTDYVFFIVMSIVFLASFSNLMSFAQAFSQISAGISRIKAIMDVPELTMAEIAGITDSETAGMTDADSYIEFRDVSFAYRKTKVLEHVHLTLPRGSFTAFVGASGAGKSTAAQLIPRFWDVSEGAIFVDGKDVKAYPAKELGGTVFMKFHYISVPANAFFSAEHPAVENLRC